MLPRRGASLNVPTRRPRLVSRAAREYVKSVNIGGVQAMTLAPLLNAPLAIQLHAWAALGAFALGVVQLAGVNGTASHRTLGWVWVGLMLVVAVSSFWIHHLRIWGPWSPIHLLSILALAILPLAIWFARRGVIVGHKLT